MEAVFLVFIALTEDFFGEEFGVEKVEGSSFGSEEGWGVAVFVFLSEGGAVEEGGLIDFPEVIGAKEGVCGGVSLVVGYGEGFFGKGVW